MAFIVYYCMTWFPFHTHSSSSSLLSLQHCRISKSSSTINFFHLNHSFLQLRFHFHSPNWSSHICLICFEIMYILVTIIIIIIVITIIIIIIISIIIIIIITIIIVITTIISIIIYNNNNEKNNNNVNNNIIIENINNN